jgi:putative ABC transport system substrate-binding protein
MRRREFIGAFAGALVAPRALRAQQSGEQRTIGYLAGGRQSMVSDLVASFVKGLRELGYEDGLNVRIVFRFAEGHPDRLPGLAEEIVRLNPAVILAGAVDSAVVTRKITSTIPIVSPTLADAVHLGLVASQARPGGNVTGITPYVEGLPEKQIELAREVVPAARKVGLLGNSNDPKMVPQRDELLAAGRKLGLDIVAPEVRDPSDIAGAMQSFAEAKADVVIVLQTTMLLSERRAIAKAAAANGLPMIYGYRQHVEDGGLISYGVDLRWCFHRSASFVHKILNGAHAGDLPLEFPARLQMIVNLRTAQALGITLPASLLARADEVIE